MLGCIRTVIIVGLLISNPVLLAMVCWILLSDMV